MFGDRYCSSEIKTNSNPIMHIEHSLFLLGLLLPFVNDDCNESIL